MFDFQRFIQSKRSIECRKRILHLQYGQDIHSLSLKTIRIQLDYRGKRYYFDKETRETASLNNPIWHYNGGKYMYLDKKTGKKMEMLRIRLLQVFFLETFGLTPLLSQEHAEQFSLLLDTWAKEEM